MKKKQQTQDSDLIDWFLKGWNDEKRGTTSSPPNEEAASAYDKGAKDYQKERGPKCFLTQEGIMKIIKS